MQSPYPTWFFSVALFVQCCCVQAQGKWQVGFQGGLKMSFSETYSGEFLKSPDSTRFYNAHSITHQAGGLIKMRVGKSRFYLETGVFLSGHAHNFKPAWPQSNYLGEKLGNRLVYQMIEFPLKVELRFAKNSSKWAPALFLGGKAAYFGFRPYAGERFPWSYDYRASPIHARSVFYVPGDARNERRYFFAESGILPFYGAFAITAGCVVYYRLNSKIAFRGSLSATKGLSVASTEDLEVITAYRDNYGVLIMSSPEKWYSSISEMNDVSFDLAILYGFGKKE